MSEQPSPGEVRKFAPERKPEMHPTDRAGEALLAMLNEAAKLSSENRECLTDLAHDLSRQLEAAHDRINQLQDDVEHFRGRAASAEKWLDLIEKEVEHTLIAPLSARWREQASMQ
jgi:hypothetical protein